MLDSVTQAAKNKQLALFAAYAAGQLEALHSDHRLYLEHPNIRQDLPQDELRCGRRDGHAWLAELEARHLDLEYAAQRGAVARMAARLGDSA